MDLTLNFAYVNYPSETAAFLGGKDSDSSFPHSAAGEVGWEGMLIRKVV